MMTKGVVTAMTADFVFAEMLDSHSHKDRQSG